MAPLLRAGAAVTWCRTRGCLPQRLRGVGHVRQIARVPDAPDPAPHSPSPSDDAPAGASPDAAPDAVPSAASDPARGRRLGDPIDERPVPRGCHPVVFGVVMGTIQLALTLYFMRSC